MRIVMCFAALLCGSYIVPALCQGFVGKRKKKPKTPAKRKNAPKAEDEHNLIDADRGVTGAIPATIPIFGNIKYPLGSFDRPPPSTNATLIEELQMQVLRPLWNAADFKNSTEVLRRVEQLAWGDHVVIPGGDTKPSSSFPRTWFIVCYDGRARRNSYPEDYAYQRWRLRNLEVVKSAHLMANHIENHHLSVVALNVRKKVFRGVCNDLAGNDADTKVQEGTQYPAFFIREFLHDRNELAFSPEFEDRIGDEDMLTSFLDRGKVCGLSIECLTMYVGQFLHPRHEEVLEGAVFGGYRPFGRSLMKAGDGTEDEGEDEDDDDLEQDDTDDTDKNAGGVGVEEEAEDEGVGDDDEEEDEVESEREVEEDVLPENAASRKAAAFAALHSSIPPPDNSFKPRTDKCFLESLDAHVSLRGVGDEFENILNDDLPPIFVVHDRRYTNRESVLEHRLKRAGVFYFHTVTVDDDKNSNFTMPSTLFEADQAAHECLLGKGDSSYSEQAFVGGQCPGLPNMNTPESDDEEEEPWDDWSHAFCSGIAHGDYDREVVVSMLSSYMS